MFRGRDEGKCAKPLIYLYGVQLEGADRLAEMTGVTTS